MVCLDLCLMPVTAISITVRHPVVGSSSWTGQAHERGQQGRRQGHTRGGLGIESMAEKRPHRGGRFEACTPCLLYVARDVLAESDAKKHNLAGEPSTRR